MNRRNLIWGIITILLVSFANLNCLGQEKQHKYVDLDKDLNEISGLALSPDGRLFAHGDEKGTIYQLNAKTGEVIKEFEIGDKKVEEDFEGIAIVGKVFYLVVSNGDIYEFEEGKNKEEVDYKVYDTGLESKFDVEGLCYDKNTNSLLLACKEFAGKNIEESRAVYSFDLTKKELNEKPRFVISLKRIDKKWNVDKFNPSAIERHPNNGNFYILGGKGLVILVVSSDGNLIDEITLDKKYHNQPEGITFLNDGTMIISDEAGKEKATLTFYVNTQY